jgi:Na+/H+-dicarboxylate symporter
VLDGIDGFAHMLFAAFGFIMRLAPLGAFGAMAFTVGRYGIKSIGSLGLLIGTFYVACIFFVAVVLGGLARIHGFKLWQLMRYIKEELLVVLGTSSSEPVLPRLLMKLERESILSALAQSRGARGRAWHQQARDKETTQYFKFHEVPP